MATCSAPECEDDAHAKGLCNRHYIRWRRYGDLNAGGVPRDHRPLAERFMDQVEVTEGCWLWTGPTVEGYGRVKAAGEVQYAHRVSYELHVGPIPAGAHLDHTCHNEDLTCRATSDCPHRRCVRPEHLEPVKPGVNSQRANARRVALGGYK